MLVATDGGALARAARQYGAEAPWLRPASIARSSSPVVDAVLHALDRLRHDDGYEPETVVLLQPTSPFRTAASIARGLRVHRRAQGASVVAVSPAVDHPLWCKRINARGVLVPFVPGRVPAQRQQLPPAFRVNGALYIATPRTLRRSRTFYSARTRALVLDEVEGLDIDTPFDLVVARALWSARAAGRF